MQTCLWKDNIWPGAFSLGYLQCKLFGIILEASFYAADNLVLANLSGGIYYCLGYKYGTGVSVVLDGKPITKSWSKTKPTTCILIGFMEPQSSQGEICHHGSPVRLHPWRVCKCFVWLVAAQVLSCSRTLAARFYNADLFDGDLTSWDTTLVTSMKRKWAAHHWLNLVSQDSCLPFNVAFISFCRDVRVLVPVLIGVW